MKTKIDARLEAKRIVFSYEKELIGCSSQNSKLIKMFELGFEFATKPYQLELKEPKLEDVHNEIRKLAVAWGDAYHLGTIEIMQLGMQIQHVFNVINSNTNDKNKLKCLKCEDYKWDVIDNQLVPCSECNPDGKHVAKKITVCLGCGYDINKRDCGCPAGTENRLLKYEN